MKKRSALVAVGLAATVAALMAGCSTQSQTADCVDSTGRVIPDSYCYSSNNNYYYNHTYYRTHWLYGGHITRYGGYAHATGGSYSPAAGANVTSRSGYSISHGGFGHSSFGHFGGGRS